MMRDDRLDLLHLGGESELRDRAIAQADADPIVPNQGVSLSQTFEKPPQVRVFPFILQVTDPPGRAHQRRPIARNRASNRPTIDAAAERDPLLHVALHASS